MARGIQIVFDANDPEGLAAFWIDALGYITQPPPPDFASWDEWAVSVGIPQENWNDARAIVDPDGDGPRVFIQKVPEQKTSKNRVHLDLNIGGGPGTPIDERRRRVDAEVERLVERGASAIEPISQRDEYWVVMNDPEGNEFCVH